jgi:hypothetical protein
MLLRPGLHAIFTESSGTGPPYVRSLRRSSDRISLADFRIFVLLFDDCAVDFGELRCRSVLVMFTLLLYSVATFDAGCADRVVLH